MRLILRVLVGLISLLMLSLAVSIWSDPARFPATLGLVPGEPLGRATMRADLGAFFGVVGGFGLLAAVRNNRYLLTAPLVLVAVALSGRALTVALEGFQPAMAQPMLIEAVMVALFGAGRRFFGAGGARTAG